MINLARRHKLINVKALNERALKYMREKLVKLKRKTDKSTPMLGDLDHSQQFDRKVM